MQCNQLRRVNEAFLDAAVQQSSGGRIEFAFQAIGLRSTQRRLQGLGRSLVLAMAEELSLEFQAEFMLSGMHGFETCCIAGDDGLCVANFRHPKSEIRNVGSKLKGR
jgi:hypothetical protein